MRSMSTLIVITSALGLATARAQESAPAGSYQQTCSQVNVKKGNLYAKCKDEKGKTHSARLEHYERCGSEIINKNGSLECSGGSAAPAQPPGSYTQTCKNIQMRGTTLHAVCRSIDGRELPTSLREANRCVQGVVNMNGILSCGVSDVLPPGSYMATCKDIWLRGTTLQASCNNGKDRWVSTELREANKCPGDIANHQGTLRCTEFKRVERR